jgi:hypothetical protein
MLRRKSNPRYCVTHFIPIGKFFMFNTKKTQKTAPHFLALVAFYILLCRLTEWTNMITA